jgi:adenylosuccinate lyase
MGKELANFYSRIDFHFHLINKFKPSGKINGAVGNYNAHYLIDSKINWTVLSKRFVNSLGLDWTKYSTQIEPKDNLATMISYQENLNNVLIDFSQDIWLYISKGYIKQKLDRQQCRIKSIQ